ncbi:MotE family protein [Hirschia baltica]|uniref:Magnesium transporter MgtE intracellular domain-containing protein n=1 Tax=Hirschia baltica (strain ATCC 49814 / DSM 5838 / IFAM 1418) TaxID=582402 RepID=C6XN66_HIRBI|nr:hypothetical protein [Hirschia baltica]ACT58236.1 conserved hypothetical protein [Hirschia baltica ATCC 49814]
MAKTIRLMPALIAVSLGSIALKAVDIAEAATEPSETDHAEAPEHAENDGHDAPDVYDDTGHEDDFDEMTDVNYSDSAEVNDDACMAVPDFTAETGLSQYEIEVLRSLADRRVELDERADDLDTREQMAAAAEARLDEQIAELKELETGVQSLLATMEQKRDERLEGLVNVYQSMKPKDAARIFESLSDEVLLEVSQRMKYAQLGAVMSSMSSKRAEELTRLLAERAELPDTAEDLLAQAEAG